MRELKGRECPPLMRMPPIDPSFLPSFCRGTALESWFPDFNFIMAMRLWSLAGAQGAPFFVGGRAGGLLGSHVPIATWLNPHSTTGLAIEISKFFNIQFWGRQLMITRFVAMGMSPYARKRPVTGRLPGGYRPVRTYGV
jgi:hypothetical protein